MSLFSLPLVNSRLNPSADEAWAHNLLKIWTTPKNDTTVVGPNNEVFFDIYSLADVDDDV